MRRLLSAFLPPVSSLQSPAFRASCAALVLGSSFVTFAADPPRVTITVESPKPAVVADKPPFAGQRASVDVAILLDTSNSMDGLIGQAKAQLWTIVQQFAKAKKNGQTPLLRVALFEYGNTRLPASEGYIRQVLPLSDDLDKLSEALFALTTSGGDEYCGQVIDEAIKRLAWSGETNGYKAIFIAGNEPFTQGPVDYHVACKKAIERGIVVNTIHCGNQSEGLVGRWQDGARLAEGEYFNIDQDRAVVQIRCPQDDIIIRLNSELNKTYLWFGSVDARASFAANQVAQDANARQAGEATAVDRAALKARSNTYNYGRADLVDALAVDREVLKNVKKEEMPEELQRLAEPARQKYVEEMAAKRAAIQKQIAAASSEREEYLAQERAKSAVPGQAATLGDAVVKALGMQLEKSGFETDAK